MFLSICLYIVSDDENKDDQSTTPYNQLHTWKQGSWGQQGAHLGRLDPGGPHVGPVNFAKWDIIGYVRGSDTHNRLYTEAYIHML